MHQPTMQCKHFIRVQIPAVFHENAIVNFAILKSYECAVQAFALKPLQRKPTVTSAPAWIKLIGSWVKTCWELPLSINHDFLDAPTRKLMILAKFIQRQLDLRKLVWFKDHWDRKDMFNDLDLAYFGHVRDVKRSKHRGYEAGKPSGAACAPTIRKMQHFLRQHITCCLAKGMKKLLHVTIFLDFSHTF